MDLQEILSGISTNDLIFELSHREGIVIYEVPLNIHYKIEMRNSGESRGTILESHVGPTTIITYNP